MKLPILVEHFREHRQQDPTISFLDFIGMHYQGEVVIDEDYQRDQQLPMRDGVCISLVINNFFETQQLAVYTFSQPELPRQFSFYHEAGKLHFASFEIFQPPRFS